MGAEGGRPFRGRAQRDPGLRPDRVRFGARRGRLERGQVVGRERADELVLAERLEEPGGGQVTLPAVALGERRVRDLADERLDEAVLAPFG